jgi:hypothetical protein
MYSKNELQEKINKDSINVMLSNIEINDYDLSLMQDQTHPMFWWLLSHVLLCVCMLEHTTNETLIHIARKQNTKFT